jgi:hypothetical protein
MGGWLIELRDKTTNVCGDLLADPGDFLAAVNPAGLTGITNGWWQHIPSWDKVELSLICSAAATFLVCVSGVNPQSDPNVPGNAPDNNNWDGYPLFYGQNTVFSPVASVDPTTGQIAFSAGGEVALPIRIQNAWIKVKVISNNGRVSAPIRGV